jgi:hypothetical protein
LTNITLFFAFLPYFYPELSLSFSFSYFPGLLVPFITTEFFFKIDFAPCYLFLGTFTAYTSSFLSSVNPKFYLTSSLIKSSLLPKMLYELPSSESSPSSSFEFLYIYLILSSFKIELLLFITIPSIPDFDIDSNFDLRTPLVFFVYSTLN